MNYSDKDIIIYTWVVSGILVVPPILSIISAVTARPNGNRLWMLNFIAQLIIALPAIIIIELVYWLSMASDAAAACIWGTKPPDGNNHLNSETLREMLRNARTSSTEVGSIVGHRTFLTMSLGALLFVMSTAITVTVSAELCQIDSSTLTTCTVGPTQAFQAGPDSLWYISPTDWYSANVVANNIAAKYTLSGGQAYTSPTCCGPTQFCSEGYKVCESCLDLGPTDAGVVYVGSTRQEQCSGTGNGIAISFGVGVAIGPLVPTISVGYVHTWVTTTCPAAPVELTATDSLTERRTIDMTLAEKTWHIGSANHQTEYFLCSVYEPSCVVMPADPDSGLHVIGIKGGLPTTSLSDIDYLITIPVGVASTVENLEVPWGPTMTPSIVDYSASNCLDVFYATTGTTTFEGSPAQWSNDMNANAVIKREDALVPLIVSTAQGCNLEQQNTYNAGVFSSFVQTIEAGTNSVWTQCTPAVKTPISSLQLGYCTPDQNAGVQCPVSTGHAATVSYQGTIPANVTNVTVTGTAVYSNDTKCTRYSNGLSTCVTPATSWSDNASQPVPYIMTGSGPWFDTTNRSDLCDFSCVATSSSAVITISTSGICLMSGDIVSGLKTGPVVLASVLAANRPYAQTTNYGYLVVYPNGSSWSHNRRTGFNTNYTYGAPSGQPEVPLCTESKSQMCGLEPLCSMCFNSGSAACSEIRRINTNCPDEGNVAWGYILYLLFYFAMVAVIATPIYLVIKHHKSNNNNLPK
jgi:hypothetical protein